MKSDLHGNRIFLVTHEGKTQRFTQGFWTWRTKQYQTIPNCWFSFRGSSCWADPPAKLFPWHRRPRPNHRGPEKPRPTPAKRHAPGTVGEPWVKRVKYDWLRHWETYRNLAWKMFFQTNGRKCVWKPGCKA